MWIRTWDWEEVNTQKCGPVVSQMWPWESWKQNKRETGSFVWLLCSPGEADSSWHLWPAPSLYRLPRSSSSSELGRSGHCSSHRPPLIPPSLGGVAAPHVASADTTVGRRKGQEVALFWGVLVKVLTPLGLIWHHPHWREKAPHDCWVVEI